jgi:hypothetical protein
LQRWGKVPRHDQRQHWAGLGSEVSVRLQLVQDAVDVPGDEVELGFHDKRRVVIL